MVPLFKSLQPADSRGYNMRYSKPQIITALTTIVKIQEKIIKANAAAARTYKKELKETSKLFKKAFNRWMEEMNTSAGLRKAIYDYNALKESYSFQDFKKNKKRRKKQKSKYGNLFKNRSQKERKQNETIQN